MPKGFRQTTRKFCMPRPALGKCSAGSLLFLTLLVTLFSWTASADFIIGQNFNGLNDTATETTENTSSGSTLTSGSSHDANAAAGMTFSTIWINSRGHVTGPVLTITDASDFIGINSDSGVNAPNVGPQGYPVTSKIEQNFIFNDGDGRYELTFDPVDLSGYENQELTLYYWINSTTYELTDFFVITLTDGLNSLDVLSFGQVELEAARSADDGTPNWNLLRVDVGDLIVNSGWDETQIQLIVKADNNGNEENIFVDEIQFNGDTILVADYSDAPAPYPGAEHFTGTGLKLGNKLDMEATDQPSLMADADGSDEDGAQMPNFLTEGEVPLIKVKISNPTTMPAFLNGWIDIDGDGVWEDEEQVRQAILTEGISFEPVHTAALTTISVPAGTTTTLTVAFPEIPLGSIDLTGGTTFVRFRLSTDAASIATPGGSAPDGEVEDYVLILSKPATSVFIPGRMNVIMQSTVTGFGTRVRYDVTLRNLTTQAQADNPGAEFENPLPPGVFFVADSASATSGDISYSSGANTIRWNGEILAGGEVLLQFVVQVVSGTIVAQTPTTLAARDEVSNPPTMPWAIIILLGSLGGSSLLCKRHHRRAILTVLIPVLLIMVMTGCTGTVLPVGTISTQLCNQATFNFDSDGDNVNDTAILSENPLTEVLNDATCVTVVP